MAARSGLGIRDRTCPIYLAIPSYNRKKLEKNLIVPGIVGYDLNALISLALPQYYEQWTLHRT